MYIISKALRAVKFLLRPFYRAARKTLRVLKIIIKGLRASFHSIKYGNRSKITEDKDLKILIMGNGPSLHDTNIEEALEAGFELCCVNFFPSKDKRFFTLKPKYMCVIDPAFYYEEAKSNPKFIELFDVLSKVDWDMTIISMQHQNLDIDNPHLSYIKLSRYEFFTDYLKKFLCFLYKHNLAHCGMHNVMIAAGFYFTAKKCKQILMTGVDMSEFRMYSVDKNNEIYCTPVHSYKETEIKRKAATGDLKNWKFHRILELYVTMFRQFWQLSKFAEYNGVSLINLSVNSYIDSIEKADIFAINKTDTTSIECE